MPRNTLQGIGGLGGVDPEQQFPPFPELPEDVKKRFPSLNQWEEQVQEWVRKAGKRLKPKT